MKFKVENMSCEHCVRTLSRALKALDPQARVDVDLASGTLALESLISTETAIEVMAEAGYPAVPVAVQAEGTPAPAAAGSGCRPWFPHPQMR